MLEIDNSEELGSCIPPTIDSKLTSLELCIVDLGGGFWSVFHEGVYDII